MGFGSASHLIHSGLFDANGHPGRIDIADPQVEHLVQAQAGGVSRLEHRAMLQVWGVGDEALHLRTTQEHRPFARLAR